MNQNEFRMNQNEFRFIRTGLSPLTDANPSQAASSALTASLCQGPRPLAGRSDWEAGWLFKLRGNGSSVKVSGCPHWRLRQNVDKREIAAHCCAAPGRPVRLGGGPALAPGPGTTSTMPAARFPVPVIAGIVAARTGLGEPAGPTGWRAGSCRG
jgi:hypothetical protein